MGRGEDIQELIGHSIRIIHAGQAQSGAYLASPSFKRYQYSWFRDGSFIADAMSRMGEIESAERFFDWAKHVIVSRAEKIRAGEILGQIAGTGCIRETPIIYLLAYCRLQTQRR